MWTTNMFFIHDVGVRLDGYMSSFQHHWCCCYQTVRFKTVVLHSGSYIYCPTAQPFSCTLCFIHAQTLAFPCSGHFVCTQVGSNTKPLARERLHFLCLRRSCRPSVWISLSIRFPLMSHSLPLTWKNDGLVWSRGCEELKSPSSSLTSSTCETTPKHH